MGLFSPFVFLLLIYGFFPPLSLFSYPDCCALLRVVDEKVKGEKNKKGIILL